MNKNTTVWFFVITMSLLIFGGCGGKPIDYHPGTEIPEGPGVFSSETGEFTVYSDEEKNTGKAAEASQPAPGADATAPAQTEGEFEQYRRWKQEQQELEEFRRWKKSAEGSEEYRDFKEWKRWKEYRRWKQSQ